MGTCVIAADTLNEGYQSMGVWHEGRARMKRGGKEAKRRGAGEKAKKELERRKVNGGWEAPTAGQLFNKAGHKTHAAAIMIFKKRTRRSGLFGLHISSSLRCLCGGGCWPSAT